jgi:hypothetical protein
MTTRDMVMILVNTLWTNCILDVHLNPRDHEERARGLIPMPVKGRERRGQDLGSIVPIQSRSLERLCWISRVPSSGTLLYSEGPSAQDPSKFVEKHVHCY